MNGVNHSMSAMQSCHFNLPVTAKIGSSGNPCLTFINRNHASRGLMCFSNSSSTCAKLLILLHVSWQHFVVNDVCQHVIIIILIKTDYKRSSGVRVQFSVTIKTKTKTRMAQPIYNFKKVFVKHKILSVETILSACTHAHTHTHTHTHKHKHTQAF